MVMQAERALLVQLQHTNSVCCIVVLASATVTSVHPLLAPFHHHHHHHHHHPVSAPSKRTTPNTRTQSQKPSTHLSPASSPADPLVTDTIVWPCLPSPIVMPSPSDPDPLACRRTYRYRGASVCVCVWCVCVCECRRQIFEIAGRQQPKVGTLSEACQGRKGLIWRWAGVSKRAGCPQTDQVHPSRQGHGPSCVGPQ
jgi:hypothetical protein